MIIRKFSPAMQHYGRKKKKAARERVRKTEQFVSCAM